jgi:hypothetical protein
LNCGYILSDLCSRGIKLLPPPSGDVDVGSFCNELLCGCKSHTFAAARDDRNFIL